MPGNVPWWFWVLTLLVFAAWVVAVWWLLKSRDGLVKGRIGEKRVRYLHLLRLNRQEYTVFHDVYLPHPDDTGSGGPVATEVDHIVVSRFGVFVIETKNIDGMFSGSREDKEWTVVTRNGRTHSTDNPFRQNHLHARAVAKFLDVGMTSVRSLVFMVGDCDLLTPEEMGPNIIARNGLVERIRSFDSEVFVPDRPRQCVELLRKHIKSPYHQELQGHHRARYS